MPIVFDRGVSVLPSGDTPKEAQKVALVAYCWITFEREANGWTAADKGWIMKFVFFCGFFVGYTQDTVV